MSNVIYLAGLPRSGTNYIQWLLKENFKDIIVIVIWKHYPPRDLVNKIEWCNVTQDLRPFKKEIIQFGEDVAYIKNNGLPPNAFVSEEIMPPGIRTRSPAIAEAVKEAIVYKTMKFLINVKNPYGWHLSFSKHWKKFKYPDHINSWEDFHSGWLDFYKNNSNISLFIKHENMLRDFNKELDIIKNAFGLTPKNEKYINVTELLTTTTDCYKNKKFERKCYFMNEEYVGELLKNEAKLEVCRNKLSKELVEYFGYKIL
jgi:hypothetical protein